MTARKCVQVAFFTSKAMRLNGNLAKCLFDVRHSEVSVYLMCKAILNIYLEGGGPDASTPTTKPFHKAIFTLDKQVMEEAWR